jgi:hypothetical protein
MADEKIEGGTMSQSIEKNANARRGAASGGSRARRMNLLVLTCALLLGLTNLSSQQKPSQAGDIRALVPTGHVLRSGAAEEAAQVNAAIYWQDEVRTDRGGRVRIGLLDGSILNVGSESSLRVLQHDPGKQQTELELVYGRVRANAVRIAQPGGKFEVHTPVAVAGVVGTRFGVRTSADQSLVICYEDVVRVRNAEANVKGEVLLHTGEFTRVLRGVPPTPAAPATPEQLREEEDETSILPTSPIQWSHAEVSWPPASCGQGITLFVRAWSKPAKEGDAESSLDSELVTGKLILNGTAVAVEGGRATLISPAEEKIPVATFIPRGSNTPIAAKIWPPMKTTEGQGWRAPRAVLVGSAFYVLGPMGAAARSEFDFAGHPASLLWSSPCGAAYLAPLIPGGEYRVTLSVNHQPVAQGVVNLVQITNDLPVPPSILRGQTSQFAIELHGLKGLDGFTQGRPVVVTVLTNLTPMIIGNLQSHTPGASGSGEAITYRVSAKNIDATGTARLASTGRGRQAGMFTLGVVNNLDEALQLPQTPLSSVAPKL